MPVSRGSLCGVKRCQTSVIFFSISFFEIFMRLLETETDSDADLGYGDQRSDLMSSSDLTVLRLAKLCDDCLNTQQ